MPAVRQSMGSQRVRDDGVTEQQQVFSSATRHLPREIFDLAIKSHARQISIKYQRVGGLELRAVWSLPHLLRPPLQVDTAHRQSENRCDFVPTKRSNNCPNKSIILLWRPGGIRDPQHFEVGKMASKWAAFQIRKRAPAVKNRKRGARSHWSQTPDQHGAQGCDDDEMMPPRGARPGEGAGRK